MTPYTHTDPLGQEVRATLAARRDVGPGYDDYFVESLVRKLAHHAEDQDGHKLARRARPIRDPQLVSSRQRLFLAVVSLVALAIVAGVFAASEWGLLGFVVASAAIGAINVLFARA